MRKISITLKAVKFGLFRVMTEVKRGNLHVFMFLF